MPRPWGIKEALEELVAFPLIAVSRANRGLWSKFRGRDLECGNKVPVTLNDRDVIIRDTQRFMTFAVILVDFLTTRNDKILRYSDGRLQPR